MCWPTGGFYSCSALLCDPCGPAGCCTPCGPCKPSPCKPTPCKPMCGACAPDCGPGCSPCDLRCPLGPCGSCGPSPCSPCGFYDPVCCPGPEIPFVPLSCGN